MPGSLHSETCVFVRLVGPSRFHTIRYYNSFASDQSSEASASPRSGRSPRWACGPQASNLKFYHPPTNIHPLIGSPVTARSPIETYLDRHQLPNVGEFDINKILEYEYVSGFQSGCFPVSWLGTWCNVMLLAGIWIQHGPLWNHFICGSERVWRWS
jgi:hypothetical protein